MTSDKVFDLYDRDKSNKMEITEFNEMLNYLYEGGVGKVEVDSLFRHFDTRGVGYISKEEFKKALTQPINLENKIETNLHELLTPLKTRLKKLQISPSGLFDRYSSDKQVLTLNELKEIIKFLLR
jgi:hypothetical protein